MSWEEVIKDTYPSKRFGGGQSAERFVTTGVEYQNYDSKNNGWPEDGNCTVKWEFSFGVREHGIRDFGFYVYEIILQDAYASDNNPPEITITSNKDFYATIDVDSYDKIWPMLVEIHPPKEKGLADIDVMM